LVNVSIIKSLHDKNIKSPNGYEYWSMGTIEGMLINEKYVGNLLMQKTITSKVHHIKKTINRGQATSYLVRGHHHAIITKELFDQVDLIRKERNPYNHEKAVKFTPQSKYFYNRENNKYFNFKTEKHNNKESQILHLTNCDKKLLFHYKDIISMSLLCSNYLVNNVSSITKYALSIRPKIIIKLEQELSSLYSLLDDTTLFKQLEIYHEISDLLIKSRKISLFNKELSNRIVTAKKVIEDSSIDNIKELFSSFILEEESAFLVLSDSDFNVSNEIYFTNIIHSFSIIIKRNYKDMTYPFHLILG
jgi:hypothetical protein